MGLDTRFAKSDRIVPLLVNKGGSYPLLKRYHGLPGELRNESKNSQCFRTRCLLFERRE